jgi:hypothetical protein
MTDEGVRYVCNRDRWWRWWDILRMLVTRSDHSDPNELDATRSTVVTFFGDTLPRCFIPL